MRLAATAVGAAVLAAAALAAAPATEQLPVAGGGAARVVAVAVLAGVLVAAAWRPLPGLFAALALAVLEGAIRRWVVNDMAVFLLKDFALLGVYAGVLPRLRRDDLRLPWWVVAPLAALLALALLHVPASNSLAEAAIGLRSYLLYLPLLVVAPVLLRTERAVLAFLLVLVGLGAFQSVLAAVQALAGPGPLNRLVSGAEPGTVMVQGAEYLRPAGTFMHVGTLAAFVAVALVAAFGLAAGLRRGRAALAGLLAPALLVWGVVYTGARALLASVLLVALAYALALLLARRLAHLGLSVAAAAVGVVLLLTVAPVLGAAADAATDALADPVRERVTLRDGDGKPVTLRLDPDEMPPPGSRSRRIVAAEDEAGREVVVTLARDRTVVHVRPEEARPTAGEFVSRSADPSAGADTGVYDARFAPVFDLVGDQGLVGHGPGSMTLGSAYAGAEPAPGEGQVAKLAWELGLPGLALFAAFYAALAAAAVVGARRARGASRAAAVAGAALLVLLVPWLLVTYVLDYPAVALAAYALAGLAVASSSANASASASASRAGECSRST
ncbi:MAG TPA: hypothetical protein VM290_11425 [Gaiellaceae bacterium]|nr:hypothetical protein [Gaiellaceae bacterium]